MPFQFTFKNGAQMTNWDIDVLQNQPPAYVSRWEQETKRLVANEFLLLLVSAVPPTKLFGEPLKLVQTALLLAPRNNFGMRDLLFK